jgi:vacuolar-type H+-ATPase subunit H
MSTDQFPTPGGLPDGQARGQSGGTAEEARMRAREMADEVEQRARAKGEEIRERVEQKGEEQKDRAAGTADALAEAIRAAGTTLRDRHEERLGQFTDEFADQVERFSGYLRDNDMRGLMHNLEDMARRNPTTFLGSTLAAGLMAGRFLRASGRETNTSDGAEASYPTRHRPPSHREFASNSPTPELNTPREAADSSSPTREGVGRATTYTAGGPTS